SNHAKKPYVAVSAVVKKRKIIPTIENIIPSASTVFIEKLPVTVGLFCVRFISISKSTSYQLFRMSAPDIKNILPIVNIKNISQRSEERRVGKECGALM